MPLTEQHKRYLRGLGHKLRPVVMVGSGGLSKAVLDEFERSLAHHELIKVKVAVGERRARDEIVARLCEHSHAQLVQRVGNMALIFRRRKKNSAFEALPGR